MSGEAFRWAVVAVLLFVLLAFLASARGVDHHHGQQVGADGTTPVIVLNLAAPDGHG